MGGGVDGGGDGVETNVTALRERIAFLQLKLQKKEQKLQNKEEDIKQLKIENDGEVHKCMKREVYERKLRQRLEGRVMGVMALSLETRTKVTAKTCANNERAGAAGPLSTPLARSVIPSIPQHRRVNRGNTHTHTHTHTDAARMYHGFERL